MSYLVPSLLNHSNTWVSTHMTTPLQDFVLVTTRRMVWSAMTASEGPEEIEPSEEDWMSYPGITRSSMVSLVCSTIEHAIGYSSSSDSSLTSSSPSTLTHDTGSPRPLPTRSDLLSILGVTGYPVAGSRSTSVLTMRHLPSVPNVIRYPTGSRICCATSIALASTT